MQTSHLADAYAAPVLPAVPPATPYQKLSDQTRGVKKNKIKNIYIYIYIYVV